jgi:hypothetical protein
MVETLVEGDVVLSGEWSKDGRGTVEEVDERGAKVKVVEPMEDFIVPYVWRIEWWPRTDWKLLSRVNG